MLAFLLVAVLAGVIASSMALFFGFSAWVVIAVYAGAGTASLSLVILRAYICDVLYDRESAGRRTLKHAEKS